MKAPPPRKERPWGFISGTRYVIRTHDTVVRTVLLASSHTLLTDFQAYFFPFPHCYLPFVIDNATSRVSYTVDQKLLIVKEEEHMTVDSEDEDEIVEMDE